MLQRRASAAVAPRRALLAAARPPRLQAGCKQAASRLQAGLQAGLPQGVPPTPPALLPLPAGQRACAAAKARGQEGEQVPDGGGVVAQLQLHHLAGTAATQQGHRAGHKGRLKHRAGQRGRVSSGRASAPVTSPGRLQQQGALAGQRGRGSGQGWCQQQGQWQHRGDGSGSVQQCRLGGNDPTRQIHPGSALPCRT